MWARKMINNLSQTFNTIMKSPMMLQNPSNEACKLFRLNANILRQLGQVMHRGCTTPKAIQTLYDHTHATHYISSALEFIAITTPIIN